MRWGEPDVAHPGSSPGQALTLPIAGATGPLPLPRKRAERAKSSSRPGAIRKREYRSPGPGEARGHEGEGKKPTANLVRGVKGKCRADQLLADRGLVESRTKAQALILAGLVFAGQRRIDKPGEMLAENTAIDVRGRDHPWVSRGGIKLAHALDYFTIDPAGVVALDIGASTGGFTDVLLTRGAARVYAVDVGHGQLAWQLRQDPRVIVRERTNARTLDRAQVPEPVDLIVCDASFIGLATVLPAPLALAGDRAKLVALVKPQFEAGRKAVGKGGVVRDPTVHQAVCDRTAAWVGAQPGWSVVGLVESPIRGPQGNREFLLYAHRSAITG